MNAKCCALCVNSVSVKHVFPMHCNAELERGFFGGTEVLAAMFSILVVVTLTVKQHRLSPPYFKEYITGTFS